jgi:signal transduction histidine kinase
MKTLPSPVKIRPLAAAMMALAAVTLPARAQVTSTFGRFDVSQWNTRHGLSTDVTTGVARDRDGFLWISTYSGLARFDGVRFERFDPGNSPELPSTITSVYSDRNGELLFRSGDSLLRLQDGALVEWREWSNKVRDVRPGGAGSLLVQLSDSTCLVYDGVDRPLRRFHKVQQCGQDRRGRLWFWDHHEIRCMDAGLEVARHSLGTTVAPYSITPWGDDGVLLHFNHQIAFVRVQKARLVDVERAVASDLRKLQRSYDSIWDLRCIRIGANGGYWLGTSSGLFRCASLPFSPGSPGNAGAERVLPFTLTGPVDDIYVDGSGTVWAASRRGGLFRLHESLTRPLPTDRHWDRLAARARWTSHTRWMTASAGGGALWLRGLADATCTLIDKTDKATAEEDSSAGVWISWGSHVTKYQHGTAVGRIRAPTPLPVGAVFTEDDSNGLMWQRNYTIWRLHDGTVSAFAERGREVLRRTADGAVWFVTDEGLHRYKRGRIRDFPEIRSRDAYLYRDVWTDPNGAVWVATGGSGLAVLSGGECRFLQTQEGLPDNTVGGILPDGEGRLWINSNTGVFVVRIAALRNFAAHKSNWLPCRLVTHVESGGRSAARGADGRLYFDTMNGIVSIDPGALPPAPELPPVRIVELRYGESSFRHADSARLPRGVRSLLVRYTVPAVDGGTEIRFRYRLDPRAAWTDAGLERQVLFSQLRPGSHRFEVQAAGLRGQWSKTGDSVLIAVPAYFYETIWFRGLLLAAALGGLFLWYRWRSRGRERQLALVRTEVERRWKVESSLRRMGQRLISAQEDERRRIARELHDDVSQRLALLSVELDTVHPESSDHLGRLADFCRKVSSDIRRMSHALHPARLEHLGLARSLESLAQEISKSTGMEVSFHANGPVEPQSPDVALCTYRIAQQALGNAARHSGSEWASVELAVNRKEVRLTVTDGGKGFVPSNRGGVGLGLTNMKERALGLGGSFEIVSSPGEGTIVRATLPTKAST